MIRAKISELKNELSRYLSLVQQGEEVEVLDRARPIARIVRASGANGATASARLLQMEKDGAAQLGQGGLAPPPLPKPPRKTARARAPGRERRDARSHHGTAPRVRAPPSPH